MHTKIGKIGCKSKELTLKHAVFQGVWAIKPTIYLTHRECGLTFRLPNALTGGLDPANKKRVAEGTTLCHSLRRIYKRKEVMNIYPSQRIPFALSYTPEMVKEWSRWEGLLRVLRPELVGTRLMTPILDRRPTRCSATPRPVGFEY